MEETVLAEGLHGGREEAQRGLDATENYGVRLVAALIADAKRGKCKSSCRNARNRVRVVARGQSAILDLAGVGIGLLPEKL